MDIQPRRAGGPRRAPLDRRAFLQRAALAGIGAPALVALLDACASSSVIGPGDVVPSGTQSGGSGLVVASPDNPVTWPLSPDNPAIAEDLEPEQGGVLQLYNYADYLAPGLIKAFEKKYESYNVDVQLSTFNDTEEAITKIRSGNVPYDIYFPSYDQISKMVDGEAHPAADPLVHPQHQQRVAAVPRTRCTTASGATPCPTRSTRTGIGWRTDMVTSDIGELDNPYDVAVGHAVRRQDRRDRRLAHRDVRWCCCATAITDINTERSDGHRADRHQLTAMQQATAPEGHHHDVQRPAGRADTGCARCGPATRSTPPYYLPKGKAPDVLALLVPRGRQGRWSTTT